MNGATYIVQSLAAEGVDHAFMVPGGINDPFMPAMTAGSVRTIVAAHEGGAAYMADGYARASGRLGVAFGIGGPGVFNMVTALAAARVDRSAVLAISGEVPTDREGRGGFQDASGAALDDVSVLKPVTAQSLSVAAPGLLDGELRTAALTALRDGFPVHLSVPLDVQQAQPRACRGQPAIAHERYVTGSSGAPIVGASAVCWDTGVTAQPELRAGRLSRRRTVAVPSRPAREHRRVIRTP